MPKARQKKIAETDAIFAQVREMNARADAAPLPATDEVFLYHLPSKGSSDGLVDRLIPWWEAVRSRFPHITPLVINLANGPENHRRRTQFMRRIVAFAHQYGRNVRLAAYPPYHSKYNPIERCWGILERHWNGSILDTVAAVLNFTASMPWRSRHPLVENGCQINQGSDGRN